MLFQKLLRLSLSKEFLFPFLLISILFTGIARTEAASSSWNATMQVRDCVEVMPTTTYPVDLTSTTAWTTTNGTPYTVPSGWSVIWTGNANNDSYNSCGPYYNSPVAGFTASSNKDTYTPGEAVSVSVSANTDQYNTGGIFHWCWFGSCGDPSVGVTASYGSQFSSCSGGAACSGSGSFSAPSTSGVYSISLGGCFNGSCYPSSMSITVGGTPSVNLFFSLMGKVKSFLRVI